MKMFRWPFFFLETGGREWSHGGGTPGVGGMAAGGAGGGHEAASSAQHRGSSGGRAVHTSAAHAEGGHAQPSHGAGRGPRPKEEVLRINVAAAPANVA